ncbi:MAG: amidohydrolase family protein, partial [Gammaproteobacteria bacterium]|nr:amidohydrolase family protein [Gammaproteobacteria bacterium]
MDKLPEVFLFVLLLFISGSHQLFAATSPYADTVIINARIITADNDDPGLVTIAEAVAIQRDKILAVGSDEEIRALIADWTEVIDARGNSVIPGLIDTHSHIYETASGFPWVLNTIPDFLIIEVTAESPDHARDLVTAAIIARASQIQENKWIRIRVNPPPVGMETFGQTLVRDDLDRINSEHPVFVFTRGGSVFNTRAINEIERYYGNEMPESYWVVDKATGWSREYSDFDRCTTLDPIANQDQETFNNYIKGYFEVLQANAQIGVTTYKSHIQCEGGFSATNHMDRNDLMPIRMGWDHRWLQPFSDSITESYRRIGDWVGHGSDWFFSIGSSVGGIDGGGSAWCTSMEAKSDEIKGREQCPPEPEGIDIEAVTDLNVATTRGRRTDHLVTLTELAAEGRMTNISGWHASGDGAVDIMFDTYRRYLSDDHINRLRIQSDHCELVRPDQIELAVRLGATFSCFASSTPTRLIKRDYSDEYMTWNAPVASMLAAGVKTIISEFGIQHRLRQSPFEDGVMWLTRIMDGEAWGVPEEAIPDRMTMMLMMTRWAAYPIWKENALGSIEPGKLADLAILNGDYFSVPIEDLDSLTSIFTMIGGKVSYEAPALRGNTLRFNTDTIDWTFDMQTPTATWRWTKTPVLPPFLQG